MRPRRRSTAASSCPGLCAHQPGQAAAGGPVLLPDPAAGASVLPDSLPGQGADNAILANTLALQHEVQGPRASLWCPRTSTCASRRPSSASRPRITRATRRSRMPICSSKRRAAAARQFLGEARQGHGVLAAPEPHLLPCQGTAGARLEAPTSSSTTRARTASRPSCARSRARSAILELTVDYRTERNNVWGVTARNREQNLALNLLMDPDIDFVTMLGPAGTGKTLADAGRRARADARPQPLQRNHHDPRHDPAGRGHRLPPGDGGGEDGALDGRADGQPRGAHPERSRAAAGAAAPPTTCCATASRSARSTSCAAGRS